MGTWAVALAGAVAVVFAGLMAVQRSLYASAVCLLVVLLQLCALFLLFGAPLLAFMQVMIYAGAVMVLIVITIMAAPRPPAGDVWSPLSIPRPLALLVPVLAVLEVGAALWQTPLPAPGLRAAEGASARVPGLLFGAYAPATEAVALLMLLAALAIMERRREKAGRGP